MERFILFLLLFYNNKKTIFNFEKMSLFHPYDEKLNILERIWYKNSVFDYDKKVREVLNDEDNIFTDIRKEIYNAYNMNFSHNIKICCDRCGRCLSESEIRVNFDGDDWICPNNKCGCRIQKKNAKELYRDAQYFFNTQIFRPLTII
jgi:hypothetical protein